MAANATDDHEEVASENESSGSSAAPHSSLSSIDTLDPGKGATEDQFPRNINAQASSESEEAPAFHRFGEGEGSSSEDWAERSARTSNQPSDSTKRYYPIGVPRNQPMRVSKPEAGQTNQEFTEDTIQAISRRMDELEQDFGAAIDKMDRRFSDMANRQDEILAALAAGQPASSTSSNYRCCLQ